MLTTLDRLEELLGTRERKLVFSGLELFLTQNEELQVLYYPAVEEDESIVDTVSIVPVPGKGAEVLTNFLSSLFEDDGLGTGELDLLPLEEP